MTDAGKTIRYYETNADEYAARTISADLSPLYRAFEARLRPGCRILDLGSGSGRDSRHFLEKGYDVLAADPSPAMCAKTRETAGARTVPLRAEDLEFSDAFDAVWACASLLHVRERDMPDVLNRISSALKTGGTAYLSWKYGSGEREDGQRRYTDYTPESLERLLAGVPSLRVVSIWVTEDLLPGRTVRWVNALAEKVSDPVRTDGKAGAEHP